MRCFVAKDAPESCPRPLDNFGLVLTSKVLRVKSPFGMAMAHSGRLRRVKGGILAVSYQLGVLTRYSVC